MFDELKLTQRLKGFVKLFLASLLWLLVRPISIVVSAPIYAVVKTILYISHPFGYWMRKLEYDQRESIVDQMKYNLSIRLIIHFFHPIISFFL